MAVVPAEPSWAPRLKFKNGWPGNAKPLARALIFEGMREVRVRDQGTATNFIGLHRPAMNFSARPSTGVGVGAENFAALGGCLVWD